MNIDLRRKLFPILLLLFVTMICSCTPGTITTGPKDAKFHGQWYDADVGILIVHRFGLLTAHGINTNEEAAWDRLSFSGKVTAIGAAKGEAILWTTGPSGNSVRIATVPVQLVRSENTVTFDLDYYSSYDNAEHNEHYLLQKQL